jgi:hypothetical protein
MSRVINATGFLQINCALIDVKIAKLLLFDVYRQLHSQPRRMKQKLCPILLALLLFAPHCKKTDLDFEDKSVPGEISLFHLLDSYPALKNAFEKLGANTFNQTLNSSLTINRDKAINFLPLLAKTIYHPEHRLQDFLKRLANVLETSLLLNSTQFSSIEQIRKKAANQPGNLLADNTVILGKAFEYIAANHDGAKINSIMKALIDYLVTPTTVQDFKDIEDFLKKLLQDNTNTQTAMRQFVGGFSEILGDADCKQLIQQMAKEFGRLLNSQVNNIQFREIFRQLLVNLYNYFVSGGSAFATNAGTAFNGALFSPNASFPVQGTFKSFKNLITDNAAKSPGSYPFELLSQGLARIDYDFTTDELERGLQSFLNLNLNLQNRSSAHKGLSLLESALYTMAAASNFGFTYSSVYSRNGLATAGSTAGNGVMTIGDAVNSMGVPLITLGPMIANDNQIKRDNTSYYFDKNSPALIMLEGESRGDVGNNFGNTTNPSAPSVGSLFTNFPSAGAAQDSSTTRWIISWIAKATWKGYGPYYNKNKQDGSGNYLAPDGSIYMSSTGNGQKYQPNWHTSYYCIEDTVMGLTWGSNGAGNNCGNSSPPYAGNPAHGRYSIPEIIQDAYSSPNRQCDSDEECIYKNFHWLMYEKRFVFILPINMPGAGAFGAIVGNGIAGVLNARMYSTSFSDNGKWLKSGTYIKSSYNVTGDLTNFSSIPGDAAIHMEFFTNTFTPGSSFSTPAATGASFLLNAGHLMPDFIGVNARSLTYLGLISNGDIPSSQVMANWDKRSHLLPLVAAMLGEWYSQIDNPNGKNIFYQLTQLIEPITYPRLFVGAASPSFNHMEPRTQGPTNWLTNDTTTASPGSVIFEAYWPNETYKTPLTLMTDTTAYAGDGLLGAVAGTKLLTNTMQLFKILGSSKFNAPRSKIFTALKSIFNEIKTNADAPATNQFNFEQFFNSASSPACNLATRTSSGVECNLALFATQSSFTNYNDYYGVLGNILDDKSPYSAQNEISNLISTFNTQLTDPEIDALFSVAAKILYDDAASQPRYLLTQMATTDLPTLLKIFDGHFDDALVIQAGLMRRGGFVPYFLGTLSSDYPLRDILGDTVKFLNSSTVQSMEYKSLSQQLSQFTLEFYRVLGANSTAGNLQYFEDRSTAGSTIDVFGALKNVYAR